MKFSGLQIFEALQREEEREVDAREEKIFYQLDFNIYVSQIFILFRI